MLIFSFDFGPIINNFIINKNKLYKKTGKKYNEYGFDVDGLHEKTGKKYNEYGFDIDGNPEDGSVFTLG